MRARLLLAAALACAAGASPARAQTASHREAVQRLIVVSQVRELSERNTEALIATQLQQAPQLAPFAAVLRDFMREQTAWAVLEPEFTRLYLEVFTEAEVRDLIRFYETPAGRALVEKTPVLLARSQEASMRRVQAAMPQLMQRLQAAMQEAARAPRDTVRRPEAR